MRPPPDSHPLLPSLLRLPLLADRMLRWRRPAAAGCPAICGSGASTRAACLPISPST